ncbi:adenosylcobalamin-dependent ribonucleoside-diphosphate reductase [Blautia intestinalis]|uniref:adenosylcobalamin-dependent ribonucleoside-diphosphate reductase n=1 Tax=Blautia intestinalis TaxID=2763028 RepID=UPI0022E853DA|nr:adenosylcobalamin-dependent ribonucleoside-diphosphate reductase [Blautia intestinalis]
MDVINWLGKENALGIDIWKNKYQYNNESFDQWVKRISGGNDDIAQLIKEKKFLFGGRILANRGLENKGRKISLSNCYVIAPPEDNIESIFDCAKKLARTYSYGGGCGVDISKLSPRGAKVNNAAKETTGSVSFMDLYSMVTGLIGQAGRRGALMLSISCDHPDLEEFIGIKSDLDRVTKANISIRITDKFMAAVRNRQSFELSFTRIETGETITKTVDAYSIFHKMCEMNWDYAEPGMLFWDRINNWNLLSCDDEFEYAGTNPCAEEPLPAGGSCLLGSINLSEFVNDDKTFNFDSFRECVDKAVIALNEVLDEGLPLHPLKEQRESVHDWRQIGLGIFGLADMLIKMNVKYGSIGAVDLCDMIGHAMADQALKTSALMSKEHGPYPKYNPDAVEQSAFYSLNALGETKDLIKAFGLRNSQLLTIAPTGSLSTMIGVSGGIEPIFANYYVRKTESLKGHDEYYKVYTPIVKEYMEIHNIKDDKDLPEFFVTAQTLNYKARIGMQGIWQNHIDASISSTVNLPNTATVEDVEKLYMYAWEFGLKGVTIFRDGCKRAGILTTTVEEKVEEKRSSSKHTLERGMIIKADDNCIGKKRTLKTGCGTLHCEAFFDPETGQLLETYFSKGSSGGCNNFMIGLSRAISLCARGGIDIYSIVDQLQSSGTCPSYTVRKATKHDTSKGSSCPVAIGNALLDMYNEIQNELFDTDENDIPELMIEDIKPIQKSNIPKPKCPQCGGELIFEGGCNTCKSCGWSRCD